MTPREKAIEAAARALDRMHLAEMGWTREGIERAMKTPACPSPENIKMAGTAIAAYEAAAKEAGWEIKPREATEKMFDAGDYLPETWKDMYDAAPKFE